MYGNPRSLHLGFFVSRTWTPDSNHQCVFPNSLSFIPDSFAWGDSTASIDLVISKCSRDVMSALFQDQSLPARI